MCFSHAFFEERVLTLSFKIFRFISMLSFFSNYLVHCFNESSIMLYDHVVLSLINKGIQVNSPFAKMCFCLLSLVSTFFSKDRGLTYLRSGLYSRKWLVFLVTCL